MISPEKVGILITKELPDGNGELTKTLTILWKYINDICTPQSVIEYIRSCLERTMFITPPTSKLPKLLGEKFNVQVIDEWNPPYSPKINDSSIDIIF